MKNRLFIIVNGSHMEQPLILTFNLSLFCIFWYSAEYHFIEAI